MKRIKWQEILKAEADLIFRGGLCIAISMMLGRALRNGMAPRWPNVGLLWEREIVGIGWNTAGLVVGGGTIRYVLAMV